MNSGRQQPAEAGSAPAHGRGQPRPRGWQWSLIHSRLRVRRNRPKFGPGRAEQQPRQPPSPIFVITSFLSEQGLFKPEPQIPA